MISNGYQTAYGGSEEPAALCTVCKGPVYASEPVYRSVEEDYLGNPVFEKYAHRQTSTCEWHLRKLAAADEEFLKSLAICSEAVDRMFA